jgi:purine-cytosine permease-like protein
VVAFGAFVAVFDTAVYGGPLTTGYPPGEVNFSLGAIGPNLHVVPAHLIQAMPVLLLAGVSIIWIVVRSVAFRDASGTTRAEAQPDLNVGLALTGTWLAIWALYSTYTWTADPTNAMVSDIRFYLPALGPIALLAAWLVTRIPERPRRTGLIVAGATALLFAQGTHQFYEMYTAFGVPIHAWQ